MKESLDYDALVEDQYGKLSFQYDAIMYIVYKPEENIFYDPEFGNQILNISDILSPYDRFLFRHDPGNCTFPHRQNKRILCEIIFENGEEELELYEQIDIALSCDFYTRGGFRFSNNKRASQEEVCRNCRGGN